MTDAPQFSIIPSALDGREEDRLPEGMPGAGTIMTTLAATQSLWLHLKIYDTGENELHSHPDEDHFFYVLEGSAEFQNAAGECCLAGPHATIKVPAGAQYCFSVVGDGERLVMLRMGASPGGRRTFDEILNYRVTSAPA